ncbi:hypothetical protein D8674_020063 [Pyrus ussuriensis x Pyrus communis]|uniref:Uncharacterized protein n=1 Tax=Pyrus ussuriensis x Pyrus communis TaxID=2448454 RepID=A0A5N5HF13_9ROSA|nr:hypothetical protein D8674_020063 [Pyrus ussuriensis x Pyrus communis]
MDKQTMGQDKTKYNRANNSSTATVATTTTLIRPIPHPQPSISSSDATSYPDLLHEHNHKEWITINTTTKANYQDEVRGSPRTTLPVKADNQEKVVVVVLETPESVKTPELYTRSPRYSWLEIEIMMN